MFGPLQNSVHSCTHTGYFYFNCHCLNYSLRRKPTTDRLKQGGDLGVANSLFQRHLVKEFCVMTPFQRKPIWRRRHEQQNLQKLNLRALHTTQKHFSKSEWRQWTEKLQQHCLEILNSHSSGSQPMAQVKQPVGTFPLSFLQVLSPVVQVHLFFLRCYHLTDQGSDGSEKGQRTPEKCCNSKGRQHSGISDSCCIL